MVYLAYFWDGLSWWILYSPYRVVVPDCVQGVGPSTMPAPCQSIFGGLWTYGFVAVLEYLCWASVKSILKCRIKSR